MKINRKKVIIAAAVMALLLITNILTFFVTATSSVVIGNKVLVDASSIKSSKNVDKLLYLDKLIGEKFYKEVDEQKLWDMAFKGLMAGTGDDYTRYYTEKEFSQYMGGFESNYSGIGVQIRNNSKKQVIVDGVFPKTPAEKAGIKTGDIIVKIDGTDTTSMDIDDASQRIRGKSGTKVKLVIMRGGSKKTFSVTRKSITLKKVTGKMIEDYGVITITEFTEDVGKDFEKYYKSFTDKKMKGLIIDLRGNPGGLVKESEYIAKILLKKDSKIISTTNKSGNVTYYTDDTEAYSKVPIVVLVDGDSASASEILTCALQDNKMATVVGVKSYGKGIIQSIEPLQDGSGITITTDEYVSPNGNKIHKKGITPDRVVKLKSKKPVSSLKYSEDNQLQEAVKILNKKVK